MFADLIDANDRREAPSEHSDPLFQAAFPNEPQPMTLRNITKVAVRETPAPKRVPEAVAAGAG